MRRASFLPRAASADEPGAVAVDDFAVTEGQHLREEAVSGVKSGDLREDALRTSRHPSGRDVVLRAVPRTHQATVAVDRAVREVGAEMPAPASQDKQLSLGVADRVPSGTAN